MFVCVCVHALHACVLTKKNALDNKSKCLRTPAQVTLGNKADCVVFVPRSQLPVLSLVFYRINPETV